MNQNFYAHVNNEADRQALIALYEKETNLREQIERKDDAARRDWKNEGSTEAERAELASLMSAISEISRKYAHLLPEIKDPYADL